jgi:hypothetical protein
MRSKSSKPSKSSVYTAVDSYASHLGRVSAGDRRRGDDPLLVATWPWNWVPDGADDLEVGRKRVAIATAGQEAAARTLVEYKAPKAPQRVRDEDAWIAIRDAGATTPGEFTTEHGEPLRVPKGTKVRADHPARKLDESAFVKVCPPQLERSDALVAQADMSIESEQGVRRVYQGQWLRRDDPLCAINPLSVRLPSPPELS